MTPLPTTITPTLGKLIPRLASDHPGEVIATVAAIGRVLEANKLDWHDLAAAVAPTVEDDWHDALAFCAMHADRLDDKEQDFLKTLARWRGKPSAKQLDWLDAIAAKLRSDVGAGNDPR
jgi:hypothetical protein